MRRWRVGTWTPTALLALGVAVVGAGPQGGDPARPAGAVAGRVVDLAGQPVAGAAVWVGNARQMEARARTDADGRFRLAPVSAERPLMIWAEMPEQGLARERSDEVRVFAERETDIGDFVLAPGARLSARVVDLQGRPVDGSTVTIESWRLVLGHTMTLNGENWVVRGDENGQIRTPALPLGRTSLVITAPGRAKQHRGRLIEPGETAIDLGDLRLDDEQPITGVVVDQDGRPVAGAQVVVDGAYDQPLTTGNDGRFVAHDAALGDRSWIVVSAPGYFDPLAGRVHELKGQRTGVRLELQKAYTVRGSVVDAETGKLIPFDTVQLCVVDRDEDGTYTLVG